LNKKDAFANIEELLFLKAIYELMFQKSYMQQDKSGRLSYLLITFQMKLIPLISESQKTCAMKIITRALPFAFLLNLISFSHSSAQFGEPKLLLADRLAEAWYDVDMDGDLDMVDIVNGIWTEQGPDVTFFKQHIISTDALELLHDMDQDGDIDALGRGLDNTVRWYENNNDGEFWTANDMGNWDGYHHFFDVNMDGQEDLLNAGGSQTFVHYYIGPGQFGDAEPFPYPNPELFFYELMDDLDGDGFKDIISNFCALEGCIVGAYNRFQFSTQNYIEYNDQYYATMFPASSGDIDNDGDNEPLMLGYNGNESSP
jgi:hypothetical protein